MIKGMLLNEEFTIDKLIVSGSSELKSIIEPLTEISFGPADGDPDMALFNLLSETIPGVKLLEYQPMEIDENVVY
jgi:hypothetical protein